MFKKFPELEDAKKELIDFGAVYSSLSGSGATMFGIFNKDDSVNTAYNYYKEKGYFVFIS